MLPDFPRIKRHIQKLQIRALQTEIERNAPLFSEIKRFRQHEGDQSSMEYEKGKARVQPFKAIGARMTVPLDLTSEDAQQEVIQKLKQVAQEIAKQSEGMLFSSIKDITSEVGNAIDARGKPFHPDMLLEMLEKIQLDFDSNGKAIMPTIVLHPDMFESIAPKLKEWENDLRFLQRQKEILTRKREEWRDRESNRKLVG